MTEAAFWWVNPVQVWQYLGSGAFGDMWAEDPVAVDCWVEDGSKLVINSAGEQEVAASTVHGPLELAALFKVGSRVKTAADSDTDPFRRVITLDRLDSGSLDLGLDHFAASLT